MTLIYFSHISALAKTTDSMSNRSDDSGHSYLIYECIRITLLFFKYIFIFIELTAYMMTEDDIDFMEVSLS